jgi:hypothetical protein
MRDIKPIFRVSEARVEGSERRKCVHSSIFLAFAANLFGFVCGLICHIQNKSQAPVFQLLSVFARAFTVRTIKKLHRARSLFYALEMVEINGFEYS